MLRFLQQIGSRLIDGDIIYDWINNAKIIAKTGETGVTGNIYLGLHEFPDMSFLLHVLRKNDLFVDIGANVGSYTILACQSIGAKGYTFEPIPITFKKLMNNIYLNNLNEKVIAVNKALGDKSDKIYFTEDENCMNHVVSKNEICNNKIEVEISTLDIELNNNIPFLIKIDVEGYETPTLQGANKILQNEQLKVVIMELNGSGSRYGYDETNILNMMIEYGFKSYFYNPFKRELINLNGKNLTEGNTIFIRDIEYIKNRIQESPKFNIFEYLI